MPEANEHVSALELRDIVVRYGGVTAVDGVSIKVAPGECVALVGPNGAGKSSVISACMGIVPVLKGSILHDGRTINRHPSHRRVRDGLSAVPEGRQAIGTLTVLENLELGGYWLSRGDRSEQIQLTLDMFPRLSERSGQTSGTLSGGEQQMLAIARALMARPKVMLMDEPTMGLAPVIVEDILTYIENIRDEQNTSIVLVEQNARAALRVASRGYILSRGRVIAEGTAKDLADSDRLANTYLG